MSAIMYDVRQLGFGLSLFGLAMLTNISANAADLDEGDYRPNPHAAPDYDSNIEHEPLYNPVPPLDRRYGVIDERCRIRFERRIDPYGREIVHRLRVCDEGPIYSHRGQGAAGYEYPPRPYYERSEYEAYPRPPARIGGY
jgi:hypothetical protein